MVLVWPIIGVIACEGGQQNDWGASSTGSYHIRSVSVSIHPLQKEFEVLSHKVELRGLKNSKTFLWTEI